MGTESNKDDLFHYDLRVQETGEVLGHSTDYREVFSDDRI